MDSQLPRWILRLENFESAVDWLDEAVKLAAIRPLSELEKAGTVQRFEIAWELAWKLMADYLREALSPPEEFTPTKSIRSAMGAGLIENGDDWIAAGKLRNQLSHTYNSDIRDQGLRLIDSNYLPLFQDYLRTMKAKMDAA